MEEASKSLGLGGATKRLDVGGATMRLDVRGAKEVGYGRCY